MGLQVKAVRWSADTTTAIAGRLPQPAQGCVRIWQEEGVATRIGIRELRSRLAG